MEEGDQYVLDFFKELKNLMDNYEKNIAEISSLIDNVVIRITAKIDPTPQNKLKVLNLPKTEKISMEINIRISNLQKIKSEMSKKIANIENVLNNEKVPCSTCEGKGKVPKRDIIREDDLITTTVKYEKCLTCNGLGFFKISKETLETAKEAFQSLKNLFPKQ